MIHIIVTVGSGNRKASVINDPLIGDENTAHIRARQELAAHNLITITRTLLMPHEPAGGHGDLTDSLSYQPLGIMGRHRIISRSITLTPTACQDSVTLERYKGMNL